MRNLLFKLRFLAEICQVYFEKILPLSACLTAKIKRDILISFEKRAIFQAPNLLQNYFNITLLIIWFF